MALPVSFFSGLAVVLFTALFSRPAQSASVVGPVCPANEQFRSCGTCDPTCSNPSPICIQKCTPGCYCRNGLVRYSAAGKCVSPRLCSVKFLPGELTKVRSLSKCPIGVPQVQCFMSPCLGATCSLHPHAKCVPNYCGGCNADFYVNGQKVDCSRRTVKLDVDFTPNKTPRCSNVLCAPPKCGPRDRIILPPGECCARCESLDI